MQKNASPGCTRSLRYAMPDTSSSAAPMTVHSNPAKRSAHALLMSSSPSLRHNLETIDGTRHYILKNAGDVTRPGDLVGAHKTNQLA